MRYVLMSATSVERNGTVDGGGKGDCVSRPQGQGQLGAGRRVPLYPFVSLCIVYRPSSIIHHLSSIVYRFRCVDLSGYWVLSKSENFDECLKALGTPWIVRKAATKFCHENMEIVRHVGHTVHITTLNPKGSWYRVYDTSKVVIGEDLAGNRCEVKSGWDGTVLCATMDSPQFGKCETWRFVKGSTMVVKTVFHPKSEGLQAEEQGSPAGSSGGSPGASADTKHTCFWIYERMEVLEQHLGRNNRRLLKKHLADDQRRVLQSTEKDTNYMRSILLDWERWESPADEFIIPGGRTVRAHRRHKGRVDVSRGVSPAPTSNNGTPSLSASASATQLSKMGQSSVAVSESQSSVSKEIQNIMSSPQRHNLPTHPKRVSSPGLMDSNNPGMTRRFGSMDNLSEREHSYKQPHYRSASGESLSSMQGSTKRQMNTRPNSPPSAAETKMSLKLHEFVETYGITSVIPVKNPHDTREPELLGMSPEQAEETTAKLRELETDMLLRRQEDTRSVSCCGLVISLKKDCIPEHLRVWEMTLF